MMPFTCNARYHRTASGIEIQLRPRHQLSRPIKELFERTERFKNWLYSFGSGALICYAPVLHVVRNVEIKT